MTCYDMFRLFRLPDSIYQLKSMFHFSEKWVESSLDMDEFGDDLRSNEDLMLIHGFALLDNVHDTYGTAHLALTLFEYVWVEYLKMN